MRKACYTSAYLPLKKMIEPWQEIRRERAFDNPWIPIDRAEYRLPDGRIVERYIRMEVDFCTIFALTTEGQIITATEWRVGPARVMHDLPGGFIEAGELPEAGAARELLEETGYRGQMRFLAATPVSAYSTARKHIFIATDCECVAAQSLDEGELVEVQLFSIEQFTKLAMDGHTTDLDAVLLGLREIGRL